MTKDKNKHGPWTIRASAEKSLSTINSLSQYSHFNDG